MQGQIQNCLIRVAIWVPLKILGWHIIKQNFQFYYALVKYRLLKYGKKGRITIWGWGGVGGTWNGPKISFSSFQILTYLSWPLWGRMAGFSRLSWRTWRWGRSLCMAGAPLWCQESCSQCSPWRNHLSLTLPSGCSWLLQIPLWTQQWCCRCFWSRLAQCWVHQGLRSRWQMSVR